MCLHHLLEKHLVAFWKKKNKRLCTPTHPPSTPPPHLNSTTSVCYKHIALCHLVEMFPLNKTLAASTSLDYITVISRREAEPKSTCLRHINQPHHISQMTSNTCIAHCPPPGVGSVLYTTFPRSPIYLLSNISCLTNSFSRPFVVGLRWTSTYGSTCCMHFAT